MVKNKPASSGDTGSIPDRGRSHMMWSNKALELQLLSPHAATTEAHVVRAHAPQV